MALSGADLDRLMSLVNQFKTEADKLRTTFNGLNKMSGESAQFWTGPLADKFRQEWASLNPHLTRMVQVLEEAHKDAKKHHENISIATRGH